MKKAKVVRHTDSGVETIFGLVLAEGTTHIKLTPIEKTNDANLKRHPCDIMGEWFPINSPKVKTTIIE